MVRSVQIFKVYGNISFLDFHHDKLDDVEHDYHKNMTDLGHSLAQTTIKDEPRYSILRDQPKDEQKSSSINSPSPVSPQSTLVQLLTSNSKPTAVKTEPDDNIALSDADMEYSKLIVSFFALKIHSQNVQ